MILLKNYDVFVQILCHFKDHKTTRQQDNKTTRQQDNKTTRQRDNETIKL